MCVSRVYRETCLEDRESDMWFEELGSWHQMKHRHGLSPSIGVWPTVWVLDEKLSETPHLLNLQTNSTQW